MGTGKGGVEYYVALATSALKLAQAKLPVLTRIVHRADLSL